MSRYAPQRQTKPPHSQLGQPPGRRVSRGTPEVRALTPCLSAALGVATPDLALVGVVVPKQQGSARASQTLPACTL
eukprot:7127834-Prymnesium_polylepis.1